MLTDGSLAYGRGRTLTLPERAGTLVDVFRARRRGFGLIESPGRPDAFVPHGRRRGARDGDSVIGRLLKPRRPGAEPRAELVRIVERAPIRRYPDLIVHRLLNPHLCGKLRRTKRQREAELIPAFELAEIGRSASAAERRA